HLRLVRIAGAGERQRRADRRLCRRVRPERETGRAHPRPPERAVGPRARAARLRPVRRGPHRRELRHGARRRPRTRARRLALAPDTEFYVPTPNASAQQQIEALTISGHKTDAALVASLASTPHGVWVVGGTANDARVLAQKTVNRAAGKNELPVLVAYNIPG